MNTPPPQGFTQYPRPEGPPSGLRPQPPGVHFSAISEASSLFQREWATWVAATLVAGLVFIVLYVPFWFLTIYFEFGSFSLMAAAGHEPSQIGKIETFVVNLIPSFVSAGLLSGFASMALKQMRGQAISLGDVFGSFRFASRLFVMNLCTWGLVTLGSILLGNIGSAIALLPCALMGSAIALAPFIAIDQDLGAGDAMRKSVQTLGGGTILTMLVFLFVVSLVYMLGGCACGVGLLATFPISVLSLAIHYYYFFPERFPVVQTPSVAT